MAPPLVTRALLEGLDAGLLERLLAPHRAPHRAFLARQGAAPSADAAAWRAKLLEALRPDAPELPVALQHALAALSDLATAEGESELRALATERGLVPAAAPGRAADAAAWAYLDQRALFRDAHTRLRSLAMGLLVTYGAPPGRAPRPLSPAGRALLRHGNVCVDGAAGDGATASIADLAEELVAVYDRPPPSGAPGLQGAPVVAVFEKATRTLSVNTPDPEEQERLCALFGQALFGDEAVLVPARCLSGAPLGELGDASLRASGIEGLAAVRLRKVVVQTPEASHLALSAEADDLADALGAEGLVRALLRLGDVVHWALEFFPAGRAPFLVEVDPPNQWRLPDRRDASLVRSFLTQRGFLTAAGLAEGGAAPAYRGGRPGGTERATTLLLDPTGERARSARARCPQGLGRRGR